MKIIVFLDRVITLSFFKRKSNFVLSMIDGKIANILTLNAIKENNQQAKLSTSTCPMCLLKSSDLSNQEKISETSIVTLSFTNILISPLHARIRFLEFIINSTCLKMATDKSRVSKKDGSKNEKDRVKHQLCQSIRDRFGILLFQPLPGGSGNTNSGNASRRFFQEVGDYFCSEYKFDRQLFTQIGRFLNMINSTHRHPIDEYRFLTERIIQGLVEQFPGINFTPSVHKALFHTSQIIENFPLALGCYSEEAQESLHKILKKTREKHTDKSNRKSTMKTLMLHLTRASDPMLTSKYINLNN